MAAPELEGGRLEERLPDHKPLLSVHEALAEANRCLYCADAPCIPKCPTHIDIPEFIRQISTDNLRGASKTIFNANILGYSCSRVCPVEVLCEGSCVYNELGQSPIKIGRLQRYATERTLNKGEQFYQAAPDTPHRVALIGAGPASLACAHELRKHGHQTVIFEARAQAGGLNTTGIAPYKMPVSDSLREVDYVLGIGGIEIRYETALGRDIDLETLSRDFDAVFIGAGLGADGPLDVPGAELKGVIGAVKLIEDIKLKPGFNFASDMKELIVVGAGNTAMDVVREACELGVESVTLVYRRGEENKSGYKHEWREAKVQNAKAHWWSQPVEILGDDQGAVRAIRCQRTHMVQGKDGGRARLEHIAGSDFEIPCQLVALAIGQGKLGDLFASVEGIELSWGRVVTDSEGRTGNPQFFAGGDCTNGGKEVVNASAEGKTAAQSIHGYLSTLTKETTNA